MVAKYVVIGDGVAGDSAATKIRSLDEEGRITILTEEAFPFYQRTRLGEMLSGKAGLDDLILHDREWYEEREIDLRLGEKVEKIDRENSSAITSSGDSYGYDKLLLATGAEPFLPPIDGLEKDGVFTIRSAEDVKTISAVARRREKAVVIGGGLLGLETAHGLNGRGLRVTVVEALPWLMNKQLDRPCGQLLKNKMKGRGLSCVTDTFVTDVLGGKKVEGVRLSNGESISTGLVLISAGVRPDLELAQDAGLETNRGVEIGDYMRTSDEKIFAAGDVSEWNGICYGIWPPAREQGEVAGANMAGSERRYDGSVSSYSLKVAEIDLVSAGEIDPEGEKETVVEKDEEEGTYRKLVLDEDGHVVGTILFDNISGYGHVLNALREGRKVDEIEDKF